MAIESVDVIVVGYGGAGAAAALTVARAGGEALILEKQPAARHTPSTRMSGGIVMTVTDTDGAVDYLDACAGGMVPSSVSRAFAERARRVPEWLDGIGADLHLTRVRGAQHPDLPGAGAVEVYATRSRAALSAGERAGGPGVVTDPLAGAGDHGPDFFRALQAAVGRQPPVRVAFDSPVVRLATDASGRVVGAQVRPPDGGELLTIRARRGVILSCGGFGHDEELKLNYLRAHPTYFYGNPGNTGDGVRLAQAAGASLWHMNQMFGRAIMHFEQGGESFNFNPAIYPPLFSFVGSTGWTGFVIVDKRGRRFANEWDQAIPVKHTFNYRLLEYDGSLREYTRIPCYWICDARRMEKGPLTSLTSGIPATGLYRWSPDNSAEVASGWISKGPTVREAAAAAGVVEPEAAARTVELYNEACARGQDPWGRPLESLVPLDQPPFYCVPLYPGGTNTSGGPRRDECARVLDPFGAPIAGLFAAGELGQPFGMLYPASGSSLSEALAFGQIAAETAMDQAPSQEADP